MTDEKQVSPEFEALNELQNQLEDLKEARRIERFLWILAVVGLLDVDLLGGMKNATAPLVILVIELVALAVIARLLKVPVAAVILDRLASSTVDKITKG